MEFIEYKDLEKEQAVAVEVVGEAVAVEAPALDALPVAAEAMAEGVEPVQAPALPESVQEAPHARVGASVGKSLAAVLVAEREALKASKAQAVEMAGTIATLKAEAMAQAQAIAQAQAQAESLKTEKEAQAIALESMQSEISRLKAITSLKDFQVAGSDVSFSDKGNATETKTVLEVYSEMKDLKAKADFYAKHKEEIKELRSKK
jgi:hypothetical protein